MKPSWRLEKGVVTPGPGGRGNILAKCISKGEIGRDLSWAISFIAREMD